MSVLEISEHACHLASYRGFISLSQTGKQPQHLPFDQVRVIIAAAHGITYTQSLLLQLAKHNIPVVLCNKSFMPVAMILPLAVHHLMAKHLAAQVAASKGQQNLLWQKIIRCKIKFQAAVLSRHNLEHQLLNLVAKVTSGDKKNTEAQAARDYWRKLFGDDFRRNRHGAGQNALLNYGYTLFRACLARQLCASGLQPALGIFHKHPRNAFCLVDDLLEPYRPIIDNAVCHCVANNIDTINKQAKTILVAQLQQRLKVGDKWLTVNDSMKVLAQSLAQAYLNQNSKLKLPRPNLSRLDI